MAEKSVNQNTEVEQLLKEVKALRKQTEALTLDVASLKGAIRIMLACQSNEPGSPGVEFHEVVEVLETWSKLHIEPEEDK